MERMAPKQDASAQVEKYRRTIRWCSIALGTACCLILALTAVTAWLLINQGRCVDTRLQVRAIHHRIALNFVY